MRGSSRHVIARMAKAVYIPVLLLAFICARETHADTLTVEYPFPFPEIQNVAVDGVGYQLPVMTGCPGAGKYGEPEMPIFGAEIIIPAGQRVKSIDVVADEKVLVAKDIVIAPAGGAVPLSMDAAKFPEPQFVSDIYRSPTPYPSARFMNIGVQSFRGYDILILKLHPLEYIPADGSLYYFPTLRVNVITESSGKMPTLLRGRPADQQEIQKRVDNPETALTYPTAVSRAAGDYDLLILTLPELADDFLPLKEYHDTTGILTEIHTSTDVFNETGGMSPEHIRDYIRNRYLYDGIEYVLLGDDDNIIAAKYLYVEAWVYDQYRYVDAKMPGDIYYACLDGTWDYDGDGRFGEPGDGEGGGEVDLIAEVYVGRAPVDDAADVARFVDKTIAYLSSSDPYLRDILFTGEQLGYPDLKAYGAYMLEEIIDGASTNGYETVGIPSDLYVADRLYDRDWPGGYWPTQEVIARVNTNKHLINHLGHSYYEYSLKMYSGQVSQFVNTKPSFIYVQGCYAGGFDTLAVDCWGEFITVKIDGGAFAGIFNARYGWVESYAHRMTTDGAGIRLNREFWDAVFNPQENKPEIGRANQDSKEDNLYRIDDCAMRWTYYQVNLFGDPTVPIKRFTGLAFDYPDGIPDQAVPYQATTLRMQVSGLYGGSPVSGSGQVHYAVNDGEIVTLDMTETSPSLYEFALPQPACTDTLYFYFSAMENESGRLYDPPPDSPFILIPVTETVIAFEDDFESDQGWTLTGNWERGLPTGGGGEKGLPDPTEGCAGPAVLGYNLDGDYENYLPAAYATSPAIDCSDLDNVHLRFYRWLGVEQIPWDTATIELSTNGEDWVSIWNNGGIVQDAAWKKIEFDISALAAFQPTVYLRWGMGPTNNVWHYCGWNLDDLTVYGLQCQEYTCGDANGDEIVNVGDAVFLINYIFKSGTPPDPECVADVNGDGVVNVGDAVYLINFIFKSGLTPAEDCCL